MSIWFSTRFVQETRVECVFRDGKTKLVVSPARNLTWMNAYNPSFLRCWAANMNIQILLDAYVRSKTPRAAGAGLCYRWRSAWPPYERVRLLEKEGGEAERVPLTVRQPSVAEVYYICCSQIDLHSLCPQEDLRLEKNLRKHDLSTRVNHSLLGACFIDAWMPDGGAKGLAVTLLLTHFYMQLASELVDNTFDITGTRQRTAPAGPAEARPELASGVGTQLVPTTERRHPSTHHLAKRRCLECSFKYSLVCSTFRNAPGVAEALL